MVPILVENSIFSVYLYRSYIPPRRNITCICDQFLQNRSKLYNKQNQSNTTSGKLQYTIVLIVLTLRATQIVQGWFLQKSFLGKVESSNGGFWPCKGPGLARISGLLVDSLIMLARHFVLLILIHGSH